MRFVTRRCYTRRRTVSSRRGCDVVVQVMVRVRYGEAMAPDGRADWREVLAKRFGQPKPTAAPQPRGAEPQARRARQPTFPYRCPSCARTFRAPYSRDVTCR